MMSMQYIVHLGYGGFCVPDELQYLVPSGMHYLCGPDDEYEFRTNPTAIEWVQENRLNTELRVCDIPEEATDWVLQDYDGSEYIIAVVDGKLVFTYPRR